MARLTGPAKNGVHTINIEGGAAIQAKNIILATGSFARMLPGMQADDAGSDQHRGAQHFATSPNPWSIIGSGAVGVEFASIYKSFGVEVTVIEMLPRIVPVEDEEVSKELLRVVQEERHQLLRQHQSGQGRENQRRRGRELHPQGDKQQRVEAEKVLVAIGRGPNTEKIGLEKTPTSSPSAASSM